MLASNLLRAGFGVSLLAIVSSHALRAQEKQPSSVVPSATPIDTDYRIRPGEVFQIDVWKQPI